MPRSHGLPWSLPPFRIEKRAKLNVWDSATFMEGDNKGYTDHPFMEA